MNFSEIKEKLTDRYEQVRDQSQSYWQGLNPRERMILVVAGSIFCLSLLYYGGRSLGGAISGLQLNTNDEIAEAYDIQQMAFRAQEIRGRALQYDRMLQRQAENFEIQAFIQSQADRFALSIEKIVPTRAATSETASSDQIFQIHITEGSSLEKLINFSKELEDVIGLRILNYHLDTSFQDPKKLQLQMTVAYFEPKI